MQSLINIDKSANDSVIPENTKPKRAAVPKWLVYDPSQVLFFGTPMAHERKFSGFLSTESYAGPWVSSFIKKLRSLESTTPTSDKISLSMTTCSDRLVLSQLIFDHQIVFYRIHELIFWSLVWECVDKQIELFVISSPAPLVRKALIDLAILYHFEFAFDSALDMSIDLKIMETLLSNVPADVKETNCMNIHNNPPARTRLVKLLPPTISDSNSGYTTGSTVMNSVVAGSVIAGSAVMSATNPSYYPTVTSTPSASTFSDHECISPNYLENFEYFLCRINNTQIDQGRCDFITDVAKISAEISHSVAKIFSLEIRPCAQRLQLGRLILYIFLVYCVRHEFKELYIDTAFTPTANLCKSMGFTLVKGTSYDYHINLDTMHMFALPEQCGLRHGLLREDKDYPGLFRLNPALFPTADELNDQRIVDDRKR